MSRVLPALFKGAPRARPRHCSFTAISANPTRGPRHGSSFAGKTQLAKSNKLRQAFAENRPSMGVWQMLPGVNISRVLARTPGVDWVMVDCEHGQMTDAAMHEAVPVIAATGTTPVVRIPDFQPWMIKRALDSGAHGILVPLIRTVEEVRSVVRSCKFPPEGNRGFGSPLSMENFSPVPSLTEYLEQANDALLVMVQIETKEALEAVDEIAPLVDVLFIGPFDLGNNIGHPIINGVIEAELDAAIKRVLEAGNRAGKKCGIYCTSAEMARKYAEMGFSMMSAAADYTGLQQHMAETLAIAHGKAQPQKGQSY